jgi:hypothetical protein
MPNEQPKPRYWEVRMYNAMCRYLAAHGYQVVSPCGVNCVVQRGGKELAGRWTMMIDFTGGRLAEKGNK